MSLSHKIKCKDEHDKKKKKNEICLQPYVPTSYIVTDT